MGKFYKISILPILFFGFAQNVFACGGGFDLVSFAFIFGAPLILIVPLALILCFIISKIKQRKKVFYLAIFILLSILYGYIAYQMANGLLCGGSKAF